MAGLRGAGCPSAIHSEQTKQQSGFTTQNSSGFQTSQTNISRLVCVSSKPRIFGNRSTSMSSRNCMASISPVTPATDAKLLTGDSFIRPHLRELAPYQSILPFEVLSTRLGRKPQDITKLDANENPYGPPPEVMEALGKMKFPYIYPDPESRRLRAALAEDSGLDAAYLLAGCGADELIDLIMRCVLDPGDKIVDCPPTFTMYEFDAGVNGATVIKVPRLSDFSLDVSGIIEAVKKENPKCIFLTSPNNPDGSIINDDDLLEILHLPILVVLDEAYIEFSGKESRMAWVKQHENLIVLRTFSKRAGTKIDWIKQIYEEASEIQMFISNHHMSQGIFRSFSKLQLLKVAETRFASHTLILRRLVKVRETLSSMVINHLWSVWRQSNSEKAAKVKGLILDDGWWDRVDYLLSFTEPILSMLRFVDMDNPCMGEVYDGIDSMIETIKSIINAKEQDPSEKFFKEVHSILVERWNKMTTLLHLLAFALNPKYFSMEILSLPRRVLPYRDIEVSEGYKAAFSRLFPDPEEEDMVMGEFGLFMTSTGHSLGAMRDKYKKDAHMWWCLHGQAYTQLQPLAIKILSQVASSSSAERNWGTYTFIHSVKRNKLAAKKAEDLVYVHSNLRLLTHKLDEYKHGSTMFWDNDPETADLDASIAHIALRDTDVACSSHDQHSGASGSGTAMSATACDSNELHDDDNENIEEEYDYNEEEE